MQDNRTWEIERTWSDFKELHTKLEAKLADVALPPCPPKRFWGVMEPDFIRKRWNDLQRYITGLLRMEEVKSCDIFLQFISG